MKRYLLLLLGIMIAAIAMANDVITKKNGTTIQCKVVKVGRTEVEYRPVTNLDGPIYAIDLTEISNIKYENGAVDNFIEQSAIASNAGQRTLTDEELRKLYYDIQTEKSNNPGKGLRIPGYIVNGVGTLAILLGIATIEDDEEVADNFITFGVTALAVGTTLLVTGIHKKNKALANRFSYTSLFEQDFQLDNNSLMTADFNLISDNYTHDKSLGLGLRFTF